MTKRRGGRQKRGILVITSPSPQGYKVVGNWNEYRVIDSGELRSSPVKEEAKVGSSLKSRSSVAAEFWATFVG